MLHLLKYWVNIEINNNNFDVFNFPIIIFKRFNTIGFLLLVDKIKIYSMFKYNI